MRWRPDIPDRVAALRRNSRLIVDGDRPTCGRFHAPGALRFENRDLFRSAKDKYDPTMEPS